MEIADFVAMNVLRILPFIAGATVAASAGYFWLRSRKKTPDQREAERRQRIAAVGRITDGTVLDVHEQEGERASQMLIYSYDVGGVSYEASQDVTSLRHLLDLHACRMGIATSIKYDPHNPGNSIVLAENWIGLHKSAR